MYITRRQSFLLVGAIFIVFFTGAIALSWKTHQEGEKEALSSTNETNSPEGGADSPPTITLNDFHRSETKDGKKLWEVFAHKGELYPQENLAKVEGAVVQFYKDENNPVRLEAPNARLYLKGNALSGADLEGGVTLFYGSQMTVQTLRATYNQEKDIVIAPSPTTIVGEQFKLSGDSLEGQVSEKILTLKGNVKSILIPKGDHNEIPLPH